MKKIITAIIAGYVVYSCASRKTEPFQGELSMDDPEVKNGKEYYMKYCQKCHPNGEKGLGPAINPNLGGGSERHQ
jgi:cytochrome c2